jgi:hypothetical protein
MEDYRIRSGDQNPYGDSAQMEPAQGKDVGPAIARIVPNLTQKPKLTRRQHIVPRMLLANFVDTSGVLWVYEKGKPIREGIPISECWERDFYEYELNGNRTNNRYENWLARVEGDASGVLQSLLGGGTLGRQDEIIWSTFVASLFVRTRKKRKQISEPISHRFREQARDPDFVRRWQNELFRQGELRYADDLQKDIHSLCEAMEKSPSLYHISGMQRQTALVAESLMRKRWHIVDAPPGSRFLISDCPVITIELQGNQVLPGAGFDKKGTSVLVPITPQKLFVAAPPGMVLQAEATPRAMETVNLLIVRFGHRNIYSNIESASIQSIVDMEIDGIVFGKNAFLPN